VTGLVLRPEPVVRALQGAFARDAPREELLALGTRRIHEAGPPYDGVAVYVAAPDGFHLGGHAGDVTWLDHLPSDGAADDPDTGSVLSMPIVLRGEVLGHVAVRSGAPSAFDAGEEAAVREVADALAVLL
jgi:hypothetical protein